MAVKKVKTTSSTYKYVKKVSKQKSTPKNRKKK